MVKPAVFSEIKQKVEEKIGKELKVSPEHVRVFGTNNIFSRAFAYLFGWTENDEPLKLRTTYAGRLKIASETAGFELTEKRTGTATNTEADVTPFSRPISYLLIYALDYDLLIRPSPNGRVYYDQIRVFGGNAISLGLVVKSFKVQRGQDYNTKYEVVGLR